MVVRSGDTVKTATSSDTDGTYRLSLPAGAYRVTAELTGFETVTRELTVGVAAVVEPALSDRTDQASRRAPCDQTVDFLLSLAPRVPRAATATPAPGTSQPPSSGRGAQPAAGVAAPGAQRFETLTVQTQAAAAAGIESNDAPDEARLLLPPGFSSEGPTQALAITGNMASIDRGMLNDRLEAIGRGEFNPATGEFGAGFGPGRSGRIRRTRRTRRTRRPRRTGRTAAVPAGATAVPADRGRVRARRPRRAGRTPTTPRPTTRSAARRSTARRISCGRAPRAQQRPYTRQNFGGTFGGPVRIPGVYNGDRRTNFTASYNGNRGDDLFDQYATVPTEAMRAGDFGSLATPFIDPLTGQPFAGNQIPPAATRARARWRCCASSRAEPRRHDAATSTTSTTTDSVADNISAARHAQLHAGRRRAAAGPAAGAAAGAARPGRAGGRGGRGQRQGTSVNMTAQLQYRAQRQRSDQRVSDARRPEHRLEPRPSPSRSTSSTAGRCHSVNVNFSRTSSQSLNQYAYVEDVAGDAGITGVSTDPFDWGVPPLSFSSLSSLRDVTPSRRTDKRLSLAYTWTRPFDAPHAAARRRLPLRRLRQPDRSQRARRVRVHRPLRLRRRRPSARGGGLDFADFLLGLPQQATVQYGPGQRAHVGPIDEPVRAGRLAQERHADLQPRRALRADLAVHRDRRPDGQPRRRARLHRGRRRCCPATTGPFTGAVPDGAAQHRHQQHRAARRRRLAHASRGPSSAAATASASTPARTRPSRASSSASRRSR